MIGLKLQCCLFSIRCNYFCLKWRRMRGWGCVRILPKSIFGLAQNSTSLVLEESRIQWYVHFPSFMYLPQTSTHFSNVLFMYSLDNGHLDTNFKDAWYICEWFWIKHLEKKISNLVLDYHRIVYTYELKGYV